MAESDGRWPVGKGDVVGEVSGLQAFIAGARYKRRTMSSHRPLTGRPAVTSRAAMQMQVSARVWGFAGWLFWLVVHLTFLTGFK
jgi:hypothetical protein